MLLQKLASYLKNAPDDLQIQVVKDSSLGAEEEMLPQSEPQITGATVVEGDKLEIFNVGDSGGATCFTDFLDGIERTHVPCSHAQLVPIVYGFTAAVIRRRGEDRRLFTWKAESEEALYFPYIHFDPNRMLEFGIPVRNSAEAQDEPTKEPPLHPMILKKLARDSVNKQREALEMDLADEWMKVHVGSDDWLLRDGSITASFNLHGHPHVVGIIKSHQTQYFTMDEQRRILSLKYGERCSVFVPKGRERTKVYSWYLRLHPNTGRDAYFGLIRVEAAQSSETLALVDEISRWLMVERQPLALPDGRWDKLLYPIRDCEQYLRSIAPSRTMMEAALAGL